MELPWEDGLVERKVESDLKDLRKTLVAFANSVKPGHIATILIGEADDGTAVGVASPESVQQRVRKEAEKIYPAPRWRSTVYERNGKHCVRVEIEYGGDTPHFGGPAWVRRGASTVLASDDVLQKLIELRLDVVRELSLWFGKEITVSGDEASVPPPRARTPAAMALLFFHRWSRGETAKIVFLNRFWITLERPDGSRMSEPLEKLMLTYDDERDRLELIISY